VLSNLQIEVLKSFAITPTSNHQAPPRRGYVGSTCMASSRDRPSFDMSRIFCRSSPLTTLESSLCHRPKVIVWKPKKQAQINQKGPLISQCSLWKKKNFDVIKPLKMQHFILLLSMRNSPSLNPGSSTSDYVDNARQASTASPTLLSVSRIPHEI
jgi:hypothetical protein